MPIYEYRCASCGHELEALQKLSEAPLTTCPACTAEALVKRVSAAGFQLKGSGWYVTDFRNSGAKQPAKDAGAKSNGANGSGDAASSGANTSETKPAATTASAETKSSAGSESASPATSTNTKPA